MTFTWATGTPRERAEMVRGHAHSGLSADKLCDLFHLTPAGLVEILSGADWNERFSTKPAAPSRT